jgi:hypothetical protein
MSKPVLWEVIMRISAPSSQLGIASVQTKKSGEVEGEFELPQEQGAAPAKANAKIISANSMGALIAAQLHGVEEEELEQRRRRRKNVEQGQSLLSTLDEMKLDLLTGKLSPFRILKLIAGVNGRARDSGDERLEGILDEIELRARVELAKLQKKEQSL